jgi:hypothetical protein
MVIPLLDRILDKIGRKIQDLRNIKRNDAAEGDNHQK